MCAGRRNRVEVAGEGDPSHLTVLNEVPRGRFKPVRLTVADTIFHGIMWQCSLVGECNLQLILEVLSHFGIVRIVDVKSMFLESLLHAHAFISVSILLPGDQISHVPPTPVCGPATTITREGFEQLGIVVEP